MLNHVNNLRKTGLPKSGNIFSQDSIIACLVHVQQHCDETCQSRFSDLFALVNDSDDEVLLRDLRASRKRNKPSSHRHTSQSKSKLSQSKRDSDDSNSGSSTDEEDLKRKRKRKIRPNDSSDSD